MKLSSKLFRGALLGSLLFAQYGKPSNQQEPWTRGDCEVADTINGTQNTLDLTGFRSNPSETLASAQWPEGVENPLSSVRPTFDDGPHENDFGIIQALDQIPFKTPIFYYNGMNFFKDGNLPENWRELSEEELAQLIDPEKAQIARAVLEAGYIIGYHGMTHSAEESEYHMQNQTEEQFASDMEFFEKIIQLATGQADYRVQNVRPPYGAGTNDLISKPFVEYCERERIEVRNWAVCSFDWTATERRGERMIFDLLRIVREGGEPDILYHSPLQDGSTIGGFGKLLDNWASQIQSLNDPERSEEIEGYRQILEAIIAGEEIPEGRRLTPSQFAVGSMEQLVVDSSYNTELEVQYMGAIQADLGMPADGYIGRGTVDHVREIASKASAQALRDPNTLIGSDLQDELGIDGISQDDLMQSGVTFANRGLQVRSIAADILCNGGIDEDFLSKYRFQGLFIDPNHIPVYVEMYGFLIGQGLDQDMTARILATAILESGVKNNLDRLLIGKATFEEIADSLHRNVGDGLLADTMQMVGLEDQAGVIKYGLGSIGPGQTPVDATGQMFEVILGRDLTEEEVSTILKHPQGAGFAIYLRLLQNERRLSSETL